MIEILSRLSWKQILLHTIATLFFIYAFQTFSYLHDIPLLDSLLKSNEQNRIQVLQTRGTTTADLAGFVIWKDMAGLIGLLTAFMISLAISKRKGWHWFNSFLVFILSYLVYKFSLIGWEFFRAIFYLPGKVFSDTTLKILANGIILLAAGLLIFFLKAPNKFIQGKSSGEREVS